MAFAPVASAAAPVGYAQATGYYKRDSRPTQHQPLHLLDAREATAWCSTSSDPLEERLTFGFKGIAEIDEVRIYTGNGLNPNTFKEYSRARKFAMTGPEGGMNFTVADERGLQQVTLNPPLNGSEFTLQVLDQYPADDPEMPVCVTDIVFYSKGQALNGTWLTSKLKFNKTRSTVLGTWYAGSPGAPDRYLSFYFDGTYRFVLQPYDSNVKPQSFEGSYDVTGGGNITLSLPSKARASVRIAPKNGEAGSKQALTVEGEVPAEMKTEWRDRF